MNKVAHNGVASPWDSRGVGLVSISKAQREGSKQGSSAKGQVGTEKELQRLRRVDLLELLLDEIRQNDENTAELEQLRELTDRLKGRLDDKDAQIERLKAKLDQKDAEIARLQANNEAAAHAGGVLDVNELLRIERAALEDYLARMSHPGAPAE